MKYRARKKTAKRFLDTGLINRRHIATIEKYQVGGVWCTEIILRSTKLRRTIREEAFRRGWSDYHWNPLIIYDAE